MLSSSTVNRLIRSWQKCRTDKGVVGWSSVSIIGRLVEFGHVIISGGYRAIDSALDENDRESKDGALVQAVVDNMPDRVKLVFEAYYLGIIGTLKYRGPHKIRARLLSLSDGHYRELRRQGERQIAATYSAEDLE